MHILISQQTKAVQKAWRFWLLRTPIRMPHACNQGRWQLQEAHQLVEINNAERRRTTSALDENMSLTWLDAHTGDGEWRKETNWCGNTPLHIALENKGTPVTVALALLAACPETAKVKGRVGNTLTGLCSVLQRGSTSGSSSDCCLA